jgi:signal transduction histidine kinase
MHLDLERFDLGTLAQTIFRETEMINGGHVFEIQASEVFVLADQGLVKQAGRILVDNAIKYTPAGGTIKLVVTSSQGQAWFSAQDSGIGIPPGDIPHIFERFYRADDSRARATGGTGLGLSIAKWIAERHGGHLEVFSREDFGSRISLVLPESDAT